MSTSDRLHQAGIATASVAPGAGVWLWHALGNVVPTLVGVATLVFTVIQIARGAIALQPELAERRRKRNAPAST